MREVLEWIDAVSRTPASTPVQHRPAPARRGLLLAGVAVAAAAMVVVALWRRVGKADAGIPAEPVAVTVLRNETGDSTLDVLGRFAGDWVTEGLQRTGLVRVVPWSEARVASERAVAAGTPLVAALRDHVRAGTVVTGSIYLRRDSLHFHGQLIDAGSGRLVSSLPPVVVPTDSSESGIGQLRDRVMGAVAAMRDARVAALPEFTSSPPTFPAYQAFDLGFEHFLGQRYREALGAFREAFTRDTTFTLALLLGARAAWNSANYAVAESLVTRARAQSRDLGTYHEAVLRFLEAILAGDGARARVAIQRAAAVAPHSRASYDLAASLLNAGYAREARAPLQFRGLAAVTAARRGDAAAAERWLGTAPPRDRGEFLSYQARLAAIAGDTERAISLLTTGLDAGIDGFAWLPGSAFRDFEGVERVARGRALLVGR